MKKKLISFLLILGILSVYIPNLNTKADGTTPVTITVKVKSLYSNWSVYKNQYTNSVGNDALAGNYFRGALGVDGDTTWVADGTDHGTLDNGGVTDPGMFAFGYNQQDASVSPGISGGYGSYCNKISFGQSVFTTHTYSFTFQDNKNVQLVVAAYNKSGDNKGLVTGKINYTACDYIPLESEVSYMGGNINGGWGPCWNAADWYRKDTTTPEIGKAYSTNGLSLRQNADSSCLEITNVGLNTTATNATITVYVGCTPAGVNLGGAPDVSACTIDSGVQQSDIAQAGNTTPVTNSEGTVDSYSVSTTYKNQIGVFNNWTIVQNYVNELLGTIRLISNAFYGFAFLTCILMLIVNIVAAAGSTNNPMLRTRVFIRLGISILCLALLGGSALLTRLFILTCMGA